MPINYQEGKIYKIYNTINDDIYVGSTTLKLCERMRDHRKGYRHRTRQHYPLYKAFIEHGVEHFFIELIEKCPCNDKDELRKKEGEYIKDLKPSLNRFVAGRTKKEYYEDNKERISKVQQEYYNNNKEQIKQYLEENKEHRAQQKKTYYENNKETTVLRKVECECGCAINRGSLMRHQRTKKHIKLMNELN